MSQVWSERNKVVNALLPVADAFAGTKNSDVVNLANYKKCTFLIFTGASSSGTSVVTVNAGTSNSSATTAIAFKYRTQIAGTGGASGTTGSDIPSALTDATSTGFTTTASKVGATYIIEVDAATVAAAGTNYDHCKLTLTESKDSPVTGMVAAILSEPRYPQAVLQTAID